MNNTLPTAASPHTPTDSHPYVDEIIDITSMDGSQYRPIGEVKPTTDYKPSAAVWLDTKSIAQSSLPNRDPATFDTDSFYALQQSILQSRGNIQPIKVRRIQRSEEAPSSVQEVCYEVVFGHRRLHACHSLKMPVLAIIADELDDKMLLLERVRENTGRADMGALDLGRICKRALEEGLFESKKKLAIEFRRDEGDIGKAITLAGLPIEVIEAFEASTDIQYRHAKPLKDAMNRDRELLVATAKKIRDEGGKRTPAEVMERLIGPTRPEIGPSNSASAASLIWDGKPYAALMTAPDGKVTIALERKLDESARDRLLVHLELFMKEQVALRSKATQRRNAQHVVRSAAR